MRRAPRQSAIGYDQRSAAADAYAALLGAVAHALHAIVSDGRAPAFDRTQYKCADRRPPPTAGFACWSLAAGAVVAVGLGLLWTQICRDGAQG